MTDTEYQAHITAEECKEELKERAQDIAAMPNQYDPHFNLTADKERKYRPSWHRKREH